MDNVWGKLQNNNQTIQFRPNNHEKKPLLLHKNKGEEEEKKRFDIFSDDDISSQTNHSDKIFLK